MSQWKVKRFWTEATAVPVEGGFTVHLDGRPVKTPAKASLIVPTHALADRIAAEWDVQEGQVDPSAMPFTRSANAAIDKVTAQHAEVADLLAAYGDADLLCYRADSPDGLIARQAEGWDPLLDWAADTLGARLAPVTGVVHQPQDAAVQKNLTDRVHALAPFALTAFHDLVSMSGSLIIGFAALADARPIEELWRLSRIDETWQEEQWGVDDEARAQAAVKETDFLHAKTFHDLARTS